MFWKIICWLVTRESVFTWLQDRAFKTPYFHLNNPLNPDDIYMGRWWLLKRRPWLNFCIRLHWIKREDLDPHVHSHPFNYRTIILRGWYKERRLVAYDPWSGFRLGRTGDRRQGETVTNTIGSFHKIEEVSPDGCWTLFMMWGGEKGDWGFLTDSGYVKAKQYFKMNKDAPR